MKCYPVLDICNKAVVFCNKLPVYFAGKFSSIGFAKCQNNWFPGLKVNIAGDLVARKILYAT